MNSHTHFMELAMEQARKGLGRTSPNPQVGCVIIKNGRLVAKGYHRQAGAPHAEVVALQRAGTKARDSEVFVNLEPCAHEGRTGPCTEALIEAGVRRVWVAMRDPNPLVDGRGIRRLRRAGISVEVGLLKEQAAVLNEAFVHVMRHHRVFCVAKLAQSLDGRVATAGGESQWITSPAARDLGRRLRGEVDAIVVGVNTVGADDPRLTCRHRSGRDPIRIIVDTQARTSPQAKVVGLGKRGSRAPTWIVVGPQASSRRRRALERAGAETLTCKVRRGHIDLEAMTSRLCERQILSVLVEGGPTLMGGFFDAGLIDKAHLFIAPSIIGGVKAPGAVGGRGIETLSQRWNLEHLQVGQLGDELYLVGYPHRVT
ncbi:MAG: bifunctional diaminohydroxyphosphoribosylaminopyrimidine deaminase/5-amino-6-(5-phosphoribosylamino)uracil reductase RibD [Myxococcota bacterium]